MPHHGPKELSKQHTASKEKLKEESTSTTTAAPAPIIITSPVTKVQDSTQLRESGTPTTTRRSVGGR